MHLDEKWRRAHEDHRVHESEPDGAADQSETSRPAIKHNVTVRLQAEALTCRYARWFSNKLHEHHHLESTVTQWRVEPICVNSEALKSAPLKESSSCVRGVRSAL